MSVANSIRKGTRGGGDSRVCDLFSSMNQGSMPNVAHKRGLFAQMGQGAQSPMRTPRPGRTAPSLARRMGQGGK